jgi:hypothetical protein
MKTYEITVWLEVQIFFFFKSYSGEKQKTQWTKVMYYRGIICQDLEYDK